MNSYETGINFEQAAISYLLNKGYEILSQRYKTKYGEIDIIARRDDIVVFVEVKARKYITNAAEAISLKQQQRIRDAAEIFIAENPDANTNYRFDAILFDRQGNMEHIEDAF